MNMSKSLNIQDIKHNIVIIKINRSYRKGMPERELFEYTRGYWKRKIDSVQPAQYALAVANGIVIEVYRIDRWVHASQADNRYRQYDPGRYSNRIAFEGELAPDDIRNYYIGRDVSALYKYGEANPVKLFLKAKNTSSLGSDINTPLLPRDVIHCNSAVFYVCGRCGKKYQIAQRCPECGQLVKE